MKVVITLQEFHDAVMEIAKQHPESTNYVQVRVSMNTNMFGKTIVLLGGYIHTFNWIEGLTIAEVCNGLRALKHPEETLKSPITDTEVEMEIPEEKAAESLP